MRALRSGACVEISDPLRKQHHGWSTEHPRLDTATDLDAETDEPATTATDPTPFVRLNRGDSFVLRHKEAAIR
jgi:hypothetical protein